MITSLSSSFKCWLWVMPAPSTSTSVDWSSTFLAHCSPLRPRQPDINLCCQTKPCYALWWDRLLGTQPVMNHFSLSNEALQQILWLCQYASYMAFHTDPLELPQCRTTFSFKKNKRCLLHPFLSSFPSKKLHLDCCCPIEKIEWFLDGTGS